VATSPKTFVWYELVTADLGGVCSFPCLFSRPAIQFDQMPRLQERVSIYCVLDLSERDPAVSTKQTRTKTVTTVSNSAT
jgi:hypothetical protein